MAMHLVLHNLLCIFTLITKFHGTSTCNINSCNTLTQSCPRLHVILIGTFKGSLKNLVLIGVVAVAEPRRSKS